jgi:uncharacterized membrane protein YcaP (DUF421 family)
MEDNDFEVLAREYGMPSPEAFEKIILEDDGRLSGVLKPEYRGRGMNVEAKEQV